MKNHRRVHNILLYLFFAFYLFILFSLLFLKKHSNRSINIIPFHSIIGYISGNDLLLRSFFLSNVLGNIILFIPLGVYLPVFRKYKRLDKNFLLIILISLSVEFLQYIFKLGVCDVDDVILNSLGGFSGIVVYRILLLIFKDVNKVRYAIEIIAPIAGIICFLIFFIYNKA